MCLPLLGLGSSSEYLFYRRAESRAELPTEDDDKENGIESWLLATASKISGDTSTPVLRNSSEEPLPNGFANVFSRWLQSTESAFTPGPHGPAAVDPACCPTPPTEILELEGHPLVSPASLTRVTL